MKRVWKRAFCAVLLGTAVPAVAVEETPDAGCQQLHQQIRFCGDDAGWRQLAADLPAQQAVFADANNSIGKVVFQFSEAQAVRDEEVRSAIIASVAPKIEEHGGTLEVVALQEGLSTQPSGTLYYRYEVGGVSIAAVHSYTVAEDMVIQFITSMPGRTDPETARRTHRTFLAGFTLSEPEIAL